MSPNLRIAFRFLTAKKRSMLMSLSCIVLGVGLFIVTATPGSAWIHHDSKRSTVMIHVLDTDDGDEWSATLKRNYEQRLLEIFR